MQYSSFFFIQVCYNLILPAGFNVFNRQNITHIIVDMYYLIDLLYYLVYRRLLCKCSVGPKFDLHMFMHCSKISQKKKEIVKALNFDLLYSSKGQKFKIWKFDLSLHLSYIIAIITSKQIIFFDYVYLFKAFLSKLSFFSGQMSMNHQLL